MKSVSEGIYSADWNNSDGNWIHRTAFIADWVKMGKGNIIYPYAVIGMSGFVRGSDQLTDSVTIGNNNRIGAHSCIMGRAVIGNDNLIMNLVNIGHDTTIGDGNEIGAGCIIAGHVTIGNNCQIKIHATVRNRKRIGDGCVIGMASNVVSSIYPNSTVKGNPAK